MGPFKYDTSNSSFLSEKSDYVFDRNILEGSLSR